MAIYNKIRGVNKVLIDNKPPSERLNLTETKGTIDSEATIPKNKILTIKNDEFYSGDRGMIYKGNPYKEWTQIANGLKSENINWIDINEKSIVFAMTNYKNTSLFFYELKNNEITELFVISEIDNNYYNPFKLKDNWYTLIYNGRGSYYSLFKVDLVKKEFTSIPIEFLDTDCQSVFNTIDIKPWYVENDKLYLRLEDGKSIGLYSFDGKNIKTIKKPINIQNLSPRVSSCNCLTNQSAGNHTNEVYIAFIDSTIESQMYHLKQDRKYCIYDKNLNVVTYGETAYFLDYLFIYLDNKIITCKKVNQNNLSGSDFIEITKAYVRRE